MGCHCSSLCWGTPRSHQHSRTQRGRLLQQHQCWERGGSHQDPSLPSVLVPHLRCPSVINLSSELPLLLQNRGILDQTPPIHVFWTFFPSFSLANSKQMTMIIIIIIQLQTNKYFEKYFSKTGRQRREGMIFIIFFKFVIQYYFTTSEPAGLKAKELGNKVPPANSHEAEQRSPGKGRQDCLSRNHSYFSFYGLGTTPRLKFSPGLRLTPPKRSILSKTQHNQSSDLSFH